MFVPGRNDLGFHVFHNGEGLLPEITTPGEQYYSLGNLRYNSNGAQSLGGAWQFPPKV